MNGQWAGTEAPLVRADIELRLSQLEHSGQLDLHSQNLRQIDLSYMDLQGANLRAADLQGANLRGTNLSRANLQGADLSEADLDGADLSCAHLGGTEEERTKLRSARLSYALLRELDMRGFDLAGLNFYHADLSGTDLRGARMREADLRGADLSTALLHGPELQGAILYRGAFLRDRSQRTGWEEASHLQAAARPGLMPVSMEPSPEQEGSESKQHLSDREAYLFGTTVPLMGADPAKIQQLFSQGFSFARARQLFEAWLVQAGIDYSEQEAQAMWIGFARRICDLYFEG